MSDPGWAANKTRRLVIGFFLLIFVDFIWVASSELTKYIFIEEKFNRPFFTTYAKSCLFTVYLLGFMFHRPWRDQCLHPPHEGPFDEEREDPDYENSHFAVLSEPEFEPITPISDTDSIVSESHEISGDNPPDPTPPPARKVQFNRVQEVRHMPESESAAATVARLPYELWLRAQKIVHIYHNKLPIRKVAKLALQFCFVWFLGNLAYQEALMTTTAGIVTVLSASSSFFTLILASIFPSAPGDKFTLSKLFIVLISVGGVIVVVYVDEGMEAAAIVPTGAVWGLVGAFSYASYLVLLRRNVDSEDKLDIPMFFGFVGLFTMVLLWPGLYILHVTDNEQFYPLPNRTQLLYITLNGVIGTVLSEYLWLWGCFLTSSLIATLSLSLTLPMTVIADRILWKETYPWSFYCGTIPIIFSFVCASLLAHYDNWDPVYTGLRKVSQKVLCFPCLIVRRLRRKTPVRIRGVVDREQIDPLIVSS